MGILGFIGARHGAIKHIGEREIARVSFKAIRPDLTPRQEHDAVERFRDGEPIEDLAWRFGVKTKAIEDAVRKRMR